MFILLMMIDVNKHVFYASRRDDLILRASIFMLPLAIVSHVVLMSLFGFVGAVISPALLCSVALLLQNYYKSMIIKPKRRS